MLDVLIKTLAAYLLGNLMGGKLLGAVRGIDLRTVGSGNVGATNALRTQGAGFAIGVLLIDVAKGVLASSWIPQWPSFGTTVIAAREQAYLCGVAVALGHCYPACYGFKGGKGVATLAGVFASLLAGALGWMLAVFALVILFSGYVSLATLGAALTALGWVALNDTAGVQSSAFAFTAAMSVLIVWTHRHNIVRLLRGTESRFEKARVLGRWRRR